MVGRENWPELWQDTEVFMVDATLVDLESFLGILTRSLDRPFKLMLGIKLLISMKMMKLEIDVQGKNQQTLDWI